MTKIKPFGHMHFGADNKYGFDVREEDDGQSLEEHVRGIKYIKSVLEGGQKTVPILVEELIDGTYKLLDGFKRYMAHMWSGRPIIECFVPTPGEINRGKKYRYLGCVMECKLGGQSYYETRLPLVDGKDAVSEPSLDEIETLFHGEHIRIEFCENFHIHFGAHGKYRIEVGRADFVALAEAFEEASEKEWER